uniref:Uncharacterized protein n=1 Tax=Heliothis virescens TaxID=7102 RepID=A0A2A4JB28_HELVI
MSKSLLLFACLVTLAASKSSIHFHLDDAEEHFENFIKEYGKKYSSDAEKAKRFEIFKENLKGINELNQEIEIAEYGITQFTDLTQEEFVELVKCVPTNVTVTDNRCNVVTDEQLPKVQAPESLDWRQYNVVSRVKNQGSCGSCYAFSTTGNIESQYAIKHQAMTDLSEQQIVDCDTGSQGCQGGYMTSAFSSIIASGGIESQSSYPYANQQQQCQFSPQKVQIKLSGCTQYNTRSQERLKEILYSNGPLSIAIKSTAVQVYKGGVIPDSECNVGQPDHAVLLVGYGTDPSGVQYWLAKNSWAEGFGEQGYFRFQRVVLMCVSWLGLAAAGTAPPYDLADAEHHFETFIQNHGKVYASELEKQYRLHIFKQNLHEINRKNAESNHAVFGITKFADLTHEEFHRKHNCLKSKASEIAEGPCAVITDNDITYNDAPESFDWRDKNVVTPVKDQGGCGSCFAFSSTGNIEGQYAIKYNNLLSLSEQQIVDCDKDDGGCGGGYMDVAFRNLIKTGGCELEDDYPYSGKPHQDCQFDESKVKVKLTDCHSYNLQSQEKLKQLLYHNGPISIGIQGYGVQAYEGGIISDRQCNIGGINHGVLLVGYGSENGTDYWIVKNSWAETYGEKGYFRMQRGEGALSCGMMNDYMASSIVA